MKTIRNALLTASLISTATTSFAQVQEAWVARYNGGFTNKTHAPVAMALDSAGNVCVAGSSQDAAGLNEYVILRYAPNGGSFPVVRYSSTNGVICTLSALALDQAGNAYVTGSGGTARFDANSALAWAATYSGNDIAVDSDGSAYVTGFSTNYFATARLDPTGSNLWVRTFEPDPSVGLWPNASQKIAVDGTGGVYVAGWESWGPPFWCDGQRTRQCRYTQPLLVKYDQAGNILWADAYAPSATDWGQTKALVLDHQGGACVAASNDLSFEYLVASIDPMGGTVWEKPLSGTYNVTAACIDKEGSVYTTGTSWLNAKLAHPDGQMLWANRQRQQPDRGAAVAVGTNGGLYLTGVQSSATNGTDSALVRYDPVNGNQLWVKRYDGPAHGDDGATAMAIAPDGSIYVTGYSANTNGGTDIFVIKYVPSATIQRRSDGSMRLQFSGQPGQTCGLEASTNFASWATLGLAEADTNGLFQFDDTNAPNFPQRMYRWHYP